MKAPRHNWQPNGSGAAGASCADCGCNIHDGSRNEQRCLAPAALQRRAEQLRDDARQLADDLHVARQAAEPHTEPKRAARYIGRHIERALPWLQNAVCGGGE